VNDLQGGGEGVKTKLLSAQCERSGELSQGRLKYLQRKTIAR
jgi:hypothetical protein